MIPLIIGGLGGGGDDAPDEDPQNLFSTDWLNILLALGEGPIYRVNANGPLDIEINESAIDDLVDIQGTGQVIAGLFNWTYTPGTLTQLPLPVFGQSVITPQLFASPVTLRFGNVQAYPRAAVTLQDTSVAAIDQIDFQFIIKALQRVDKDGDIRQHTIEVRCAVYDVTGQTLLAERFKSIKGRTLVDFKFSVSVVIPEPYRSSNGYKFTVEKTSKENASTRYTDVIIFTGWNEISYDDAAYPRTALVGYSLKAQGQYTGQVPTISSMIKGLICKVPSNYNQPTLQNGEIDWRHLELPNGFTTNPVTAYKIETNGYYLQDQPGVLKVDSQPVLYKGLWDGTFVHAWTQNPVWIMYDMLTNDTYGLGVPEHHIDKYNFYKAAQYCDAVNPYNGKWIGVDALADGTNRYKPYGMFTAPPEINIGIPAGTAIKERRFICDITIASQRQVLDLIQQIAGAIRAVLFYSGGKLALNIDLPDEVPVAVFNEGNILKDSLVISGVKESDLITGVEVSYIEPRLHYRRELLRIDDPDLSTELSQIENVLQIDLPGCTRRSQAARFAQYLLASNKLIRRKCQFKVSTEALNVTVGDVISVAQKQIGTNWGFGGRVAGNATVSSNTVVLEHFTAPAITANVFTEASYPFALRILGTQSGRVDLYLVSNSYNLASSGNAETGVDLVTLQINAHYNYQTRSFVTADNTFKANNVPIEGDLWTLGQIDSSSSNPLLTGAGDKLFKVTGIDRSEDEEVTVHASEYISQVYIDSEELIKYIDDGGTYITPGSIQLVAPPPPALSVTAVPVRQADGSVDYVVNVNSYIDDDSIPYSLDKEVQFAIPEVSMEIVG